MLDTQSKISASVRTHDITAWEEIPLSGLNSRQKRRFQKHKDAIIAYFTMNASLDEIVVQHSVSASSLLSMAEKCLMRHADGQLWGFRALLPGANVMHHTPPIVQNHSAPAQETSTKTDVPLVYDEAEEEVTAKRPALVLAEPIKIPTILSLPETPCPTFDEEEYADDVIVPEPAMPSVPVIPSVPDITPTIPIPVALTFALPYSLKEESAEQIAKEERNVQTAKVVIPIPTALTFATPSFLEEVPVGADLTRPRQDAIDDEDALNRSLQVDDESGVVEGQVRELMRVAPPPMPILPDGVTDHSIYIQRPGSGKTGPQRKIVRKRRVHDTLTHTQQRRGLFHVLSIILLAIILLSILAPLGAGLAAYSIYTNVRSVALDGVNHLLAVKDLLTISKSDPTAALDAKKLQQAQTEFKLAQGDFTQLQDLTNRSDILAALQEFSPDYANKLLMARHLVQVALDVSKMGQEVSSVAIMGAGLIHSSPLANGVTKPLISVADIASIDGAIIHALYYIDDIRTQMSQVQMKDVPISDKQKTQVTSLLQQLPQVQNLLTQGQGLVGLVSWLLGVGHERRFLIQTLDRAELRPSGGFTGQYGVLQIQDGRMAPFGLRDVALLDYAGNGVELGRKAPPAYSSWMNFGNWGLRDSNLSGDYPTTARMSMQVFQDEGGGPVDGDISFTPTFIGHILDVTGPIRVAEYNETITSKNLEDRLHYYQQDYSAIAVEHQKSNDNSHAARKAFTSLVGKILLDRVRHLSTKQLLTIVKGAVKDIQSHDLEIYFANSQAEQWLTNYGYASVTDSFSKHDGFSVVQANISISKASQYVHTIEHDDIVLDAQGGATHNLTITLNYQQTGPVYGYDTYADYVRVYVPQNAQFLSGDGFDTGQALCSPTPVGPPPTKGSPLPPGTGGTPPVTGCSQYDTYFPSDARNCPDGNYKLGDRGFQQVWAVDSLGAPTNLTSDLPGHAMWGGLTETPKNCISTISVSWYVPHVVKNVAGQSPYALLVQKQGGYIPSIELTIDASALNIKGLKPFAFNGDINADKLFAFPARK